MAAPESKKSRSTEAEKSINNDTARWLILIAFVILAVYFLFFGAGKAKESAAPPVAKPAVVREYSEPMCTPLESVEGVAKIDEAEGRCYSIRLGVGEETQKPIIFPLVGESWRVRLYTPGCVKYLAREKSYADEKLLHGERCKTAESDAVLIPSKNVQALRIRNVSPAAMLVQVCIDCR